MAKKTNKQLEEAERIVREKRVQFHGKNLTAAEKKQLNKEIEFIVTKLKELEYRLKNGQSFDFTFSGLKFIKQLNGKSIKSLSNQKGQNDEKDYILSQMAWAETDGFIQNYYNRFNSLIYPHNKERFSLLIKSDLTLARDLVGMTIVAEYAKRGEINKAIAACMLYGVKDRLPLLNEYFKVSISSEFESKVENFEKTMDALREQGVSDADINYEARKIMRGNNAFEVFSQAVENGLTGKEEDLIYAGFSPETKQMVETIQADTKSNAVGDQALLKVPEIISQVAKYMAPPKQQPPRHESAVRMDNINKVELIEKVETEIKSVVEDIIQEKVDAIKVKTDNQDRVINDKWATNKAVKMTYEEIEEQHAKDVKRSTELRDLIKVKKANGEDVSELETELAEIQERKKKNYYSMNQIRRDNKPKKRDLTLHNEQVQIQKDIADNVAKYEEIDAEIKSDAEKGLPEDPEKLAKREEILKTIADLMGKRDNSKLLSEEEAAERSNNSDYEIPYKNEEDRISEEVKVTEKLIEKHKTQIEKYREAGEVDSVKALEILLEKEEAKYKELLERKTEIEQKHKDEAMQQKAPVNPEAVVSSQIDGLGAAIDGIVAEITTEVTSAHISKINNLLGKAYKNIKTGQSNEIIALNIDKYIAAISSSVEKINITETISPEAKEVLLNTLNKQISKAEAYKTNLANNKTQSVKTEGVEVQAEMPEGEKVEPEKTVETTEPGVEKVEKTESSTEGVEKTETLPEEPEKTGSDALLDEVVYGATPPIKGKGIDPSTLENENVRTISKHPY